MEADVDVRQTARQELAEQLFGMTLEEAQAREICLGCKQPALKRCRDQQEREAYQQAGLCGVCVLCMEAYHNTEAGEC